jgi:hypothetical protein
MEQWAKWIIANSLSSYRDSKDLIAGSIPVCSTNYAAVDKLAKVACPSSRTLKLRVQIPSAAPVLERKRYEKAIRNMYEMQ